MYNYITAFCLGVVVLSPDGGYKLFFEDSWHIWPFLLGCTFIAIFYLMAVTAQKMGVAVASIATKMSLVIAVIVFVLTEPDEVLTIWDIVAIVLAIFGIILASVKTGQSGMNLRWIALPFVIFIGSGLVDVTFGIFSDERFLIKDSDHYVLTTLPFGAAAGMAIIVQIFRFATGRSKSQFKSLLYGIFLGTVNFGSIYFLVKVLFIDVLEKSAIIPINNMGVVVLSALMGLALFQERLTVRNWLGVGFSVGAIALLLL